MRSYAFAGKGGVGKSLIACATSMDRAYRGERTLLIDYDEDNGVQKTLRLDVDRAINKIENIARNLDVAIIERSEFISIIPWKNGGEPVQGYFEQFRKDLGLVALADLVRSFFGVPTDTVTSHKIALLIGVMASFEPEDYANVVIDIEPTGGLASLLANVSEMTRSFRNLQDTGTTVLGLLGLQWPDIAAYLKGDYIKNADMYCDRIEKTVRMLDHATYVLVAKPQELPVAATQKIVNLLKLYGTRPHGCVINEIRGEVSEQQWIDAIRKRWPAVEIHYRKELHDGSPDRDVLLRSIGREVSIILPHVSARERQGA